jgi:SanA protein
MKTIVKKICIVFTIAVVGIIIINFYIVKSTKNQVFSELKKIPQQQTALLLGARVYQNGRLSHVMEDRALTAVELYNDKKISKILISGDHGSTEYDEVNTIKDYLLRKGVDGEDIFTDHAGFDTYDSLYRARDIFEVDSIVVVTQKFHLPRAIYIANSLDVKSVGAIADKRKYRDKERQQIREVLARVKAFLNVNL